jgi:hypothetical protein
VNNFFKTILSGLKTWTEQAIKKSKADWNQNDPNADNYIKNKPNNLATNSQVVKLEQQMQGNINTLEGNINILKSDVTILKNDINTLENNVTDMITSPKDNIIMTDNGVLYQLYVKNDELCLSLISSLEDFIYTANADGTYTITGWKQTYLGKPSTLMVVPNDNNIII